MKYLPKIWIIVVAFLCTVSNIVLALAEGDTIKILLLGNSNFQYNDLPFVLDNLAIQSGKTIFIDYYVPLGQSLTDHTLDNITHAKIKSKNWDFVVIHGSATTMAYPGSFNKNYEYEAIQILRTKIKENNKDSKIIYSMPWAYEDGMTWLEGWTDTYLEMQQYIYNNTIKYSNEIGFITAPVGWAWKNVLSEKNFPLHYLHASDWGHPSPKGTYLTACVIYSTIFSERCTGINYFEGLPVDEAKYFQEKASSTVMNNPKIWNISGTTSINSLDESQLSLRNYPNPFKDFTNLEFTINRAGFTEMYIFNEQGILISNPITEYKEPGTYVVQFDAAKLSNGVYFGVINNLSSSIKIKMVKLE